MAAKNLLPTYEFGGVDSRSNPLRLPPQRSLRCRNFAPKQSGVLELRYGYSTVSVTTFTATAIHSIIPYRLNDGTKYVVIGQGTGTPKVIAVASGTVSTPTVRGTAFSSSAKANYYIANDRLHYANGTDQKYFDGTTWRDNGIRQVSDADIANVVIVEGVYSLTTAEAAAVTLGQSGAAGFATSTKGGHYVYVALFDTATNELGPSVAFVGSGRIAITGGPKQIDLTVLPTPTVATYVKLVARTEDGGTRAYFATTTSTAATLARSGSTVTVTATGHGLSTGDVVVIPGTTDTKLYGPWSITVVDPNTFTFTLAYAPSTYAASDAGTVKKVVKAANATATASIASTAADSTYVVNQDRGLAATVITTSNGGYQFYVAIYNRTSGQVGNRRLIGGRMVDTAKRFNVRITGLPDYSGTDTEWDIAIGRTGDGGAVPYVITDGTNWIYANNADTQITIAQTSVDGTAELPSRNGVIPSTIDKVCMVEKRVFANKTNSPYLYKSGSLSDDINVAGTSGRAIQMGRPEQSFAPNDLETFPTAEALTGLATAGYFDGDNTIPAAVCWSRSNCAVWVERIRNGAIEAGWRGPWAVGLAGSGTGNSRAFCSTPYGMFWVTGDKQLATFQQGFPIGISGEYEAALLANIGDAYLATTVVTYINIPSKGIDRLRIECQDSSGNPFTVIHDFKLSGQGYDAVFSGPLAIAFAAANVLDSNGAQQIWASPASGTGVGQLYLLHSGASDAGSSFTGDYIGLLNTGASSVSVPEIHWLGDKNATLWFGETLETTLDTGAKTDFQQITPASGARIIPSEEGNFLFFDELPTPLTHFCLLRFKLASHAADGNNNLSSPVPHIPLEDYGRIYNVTLGMGQKG